MNEVITTKQFKVVAGKTLKEVIIEALDAGETMAETGVRLAKEYNYYLLPHYYRYVKIEKESGGAMKKLEARKAKLEAEIAKLQAS